MDGPQDVAELVRRLDEADHLADEGTATAAWLAWRTQRPLLLEGEPGVGKTSLATALAQVLGRDLVRLQCYEGIDAAAALYDWDHPRQLLHVRALEAAQRDARSSGGDARDDRAALDVDALEGELWSRRFLLPRPLLASLERPSVLLVDELDRADDEFEAFLLEVLADFAVTIPELGTVRAEVPPVVVVTSNRTREVHDALKRRCYYHWVEHPDLEREIAIVRRRVPQADAALVDGVARVVARLREEDLLKPPGVAETIDWARALHELGATRVDVATAARTLGAVVKYREDQQRIAASLARLVEGPA
ncbi:MoxR family ATPase [Nocardioides zeae]|uniref:MoxR family ATPase n=1 Tax=Nocardioides imazamoxiresistens TaxID=3231893 RepID=A0ABU3PXR1_9ACTN|nr:MoxR family ATPase [Nocardioides zeae]MDT9594023.1 MoxR family ATPase [Nocardioides zeae]